MRFSTVLTIFNIGILTYHFGPYVLPISLGCYVIYKCYKFTHYYNNEYCIGIIPLHNMRKIVLSDNDLNSDIYEDM